MIQFDPPWKVATPIGDAEARILDDGSSDDVSRLLWVIDAGEPWWLAQRDGRINTNITEGRTRLTPFSDEAIGRAAAFFRF